LSLVSISARADAGIAPDQATILGDCENRAFLYRFHRLWGFVVAI
jgi:hypothetical protein